MIPKNIQREHILKAIAEVKRTMIPTGRNSKKFLISFNGGYYPPKYVISLANRYVNGEELNPSEFSGGTESNEFLRALGFNIVETRPQEKTARISPLKRKENTLSLAHHDERCPKCKETVRRLLERLYGNVKQNYKFDLGTSLEDFSNTSCYCKLEEIFEALQNHRGFREFVKATTLPYCDFFVPSREFVIEFDESQHFTPLRRIALENYPNDLELGFNRRKWIALCEKIGARDSDPPYRDEQRAWYDTLRDFLPEIKSLRPTIRLFAGDFAWCSFNPNNVSDIQSFSRFLRKPSDNWQIEVRDYPNPVISRIIIAGEWDGNPNEAQALLEDVCAKWPKEQKTRFLITCGGFIQFDWPKSISRMDVGDNKNPNEKAVSTLLAEAENCARHVFSEGLSDKLRQFTDYITLGIDSSKEKISTTQNYIGQLHVEFVFLVDLRNDELYWTGKSYPTSSQQNGLVRISNLKTHFFDLDVGDVMVLGCHDLTIFNPRSKNARGWREQINQNFKKMANISNPICVLHHPHTTVKRRTWLNAWNYMTKELHSVKCYAGAGRYYEADRPLSKWDTLDEVLASTKRGSSIDFVVWKN